MPVGVLLVHAVEELQQALADIPRDGAHHAKVIVDETPLLLRIDRDVPWVRVCTVLFMLSHMTHTVMRQLDPQSCPPRMSRRR